MRKGQDPIKQHWETAKRFFGETMDMNGLERKTYLDRSCPGAEIRQLVDFLFEQHDKAEQFPGLHSSVAGKTISHYLIDQRIGDGGIGMVYQALDTRLGRRVALKFLQPWAMGHPASRQRLMAEARAASALNHPNIVTVHGIVDEGDLCFIVMEYIVGKTLNQCIPVGGMPPRKALHMAVEIAEALAAAHQASLVHGDLKPLNVMVTDAGHVKLLDFGLAVIGGARTEAPTALDQLGTRAYMSPEQLRGHATVPDSRSDIFGFGVLVHQILAGRHPFANSAGQIVAEAICDQEPGLLPPKVPLALREIVHRCLEKRPEHRFQSMDDVKIALTSVGRTSKTGNLWIIPSGPAPASNRGPLPQNQAELSEFRALARAINQRSAPGSRRAVRELTRKMNARNSPEIRKIIIPALKRFLETDTDPAENVSAPSIRALRSEVFALLKTVTEGRLVLCFEDRDLADTDLYSVDFGRTELSDFNFEGSFLVAARFSNSDLSRARFTGASLRNAQLDAEDLSGADLTGADWFNASGLTPEALHTVKRNTLLACPTSTDGMFRYLANHYALPFESWSKAVQEQLTATWREYLTPGGLCDVTAEWRTYI